MDTPKELMTAYQRWEMNSFGDERPGVVARRAQVELPTEQQVAGILEQAREQGREEGRAGGYQEGLAAGRAQAAAELAHLRELAVGFGSAVAHADETIAADVLELALDLSKAMLRTALAVRPELVVPVVREAIEYLPVLQQPALLMLNPQDADLVRDAIGEELDKGGWRVIEDPHIARGGCKLDTPHNQIDAQVGARWQRLAHALGKNTDWLA